MKYVAWCFIVILSFAGCIGVEDKGPVGSVPRWEQLRSIDLNNSSERVDVLSKEIKVFSPIKDAEFELFYVNGFHTKRNTSVPGASSYDYKFALKIHVNDISKWTEGFVRNDSLKYDDRWTESLIQIRKNNWKRHSKPFIFERKGEDTRLFVFLDEGIIFKRVSDL
jgi:hypothetical protein